MKPGIIEKLPYVVHKFETKQGWNHNPSICQDDKNNTWISIRHHDKLPLIVHLSPQNHPHRNEPSRLQVGHFDPVTLAITDLKLIVPESGSPEFLFKHNLEDVRIFHRFGKLHGIGVAIPPLGIVQVEVEIDYDKGTYKLLHDFGQPSGRSEKNWQPSSVPTEAFDYIYSPTQVIKYGWPKGSVYTGKVHGGSQLLPYKDGWISIAHRIVHVTGLTERWYVSVAQLHDWTGFVTHQSQYFDFGSGWRENLQESVEYVSGAIWMVAEEELLLSMGVRDETCGFVRVPVSAFDWRPVGGWSQKFSLDSDLLEIVKASSMKKFDKLTAEAKKLSSV